MLETGTITGRAISQNKDAERPTVMLQVVVSGPDDVQSVELQSFAGEDYQPPDGSRVFIADVSDTFRVAIVVDDGIEPAADLEQGERELYSSDAGTREAMIRLRKDGTIRVNGGDGTAVEYARMKTAFDDLVTALNDVVTYINSHTHAVAGTVANAPVPPLAPVSVDMSPAESATVVIP
jgi:phage gp45-like